MSTWLCDQCTLENVISVSICAACKHTRPQNKDNNIWKCEKCNWTMSKTNICKICGNTKQSNKYTNDTIEHKTDDKKDENTISNIWICPQCTLHNKPTSKYCKVCKATKPKYCWQWNAGNNWHEYPDDINKQIESAYLCHIASIQVKICNNQYIIDLNKLQQITKSSTRSREIKRVIFKTDGINKPNIKIPVILNVYKQLKGIMTAYHTGVKIYGIEYSYGNGICFNDVPLGWTFYKKVIIHKDCKKTKLEIQHIINEMNKKWTPNRYNITKNNCNHFSDALIKKVCGNYYGIPSWINHLANMGNTIEQITGTNVNDMFGGLMSSVNASNSSFNSSHK